MELRLALGCRLRWSTNFTVKLKPFTVKFLLKSQYGKNMGSQTIKPFFTPLDLRKEYLKFTGILKDCKYKTAKFLDCTFLHHVLKKKGF